MNGALRELLRGKLEGFRDVQRFVVAYSGGADSHSLLHALVSLELPQEILALHVNHGLSPNSDNWQAHCESVAHALHMPNVPVSNAMAAGWKMLPDRRATIFLPGMLALAMCC